MQSLPKTVSILGKLTVLEALSAYSFVLKAKFNANNTQLLSGRTNEMSHFQMEELQKIAYGSRVGIHLRRKMSEKGVR